MTYTFKDAIKTAYKYLALDESKTEKIDGTADRGFVCTVNSDKKVIFIYPISCKKDNKQNFFDTRDSGAKERRITWQYAKENNLPYFCLGFNEEQDRYKDYILSLESDELDISHVSYRKDEESGSTGTQVNIPSDFIPNKKFQRILTPKGFFIAAVKKEYVSEYLTLFDSRPYLDNKENLEDNDAYVGFSAIKDSLLKLDNQEFAFACIELMNKHSLLTPINLALLSDVDKCATNFKHNNFHGILFKLNSDTDADADAQKKGQDGRLRYYAKNYDIDGENYAVSSQWRPMTDTDDSRSPFVNWILAQLQKVRFDTGYDSGFARNRILFGAPGTGKSYILNKDKEILLGNDADNNFERVTFHSDYSYANFVGTYKPVPIKEEEKDAITYEYVPGPFMRVYISAIKSGQTTNPKPYLLIVEEINRANAAAVFGDVFQLLDRVGNVSEYSITPSQDMKEYMAKPEVLGGSPTDYNIMKLPDNMFIWATMNSADQGVFPMDTAFKRRWEFSYIGIDAAVEQMSDTIKNKKYKLGEGDNARYVTWNDLRIAINEVLSSEDYNINEDKLLGPYFISKAVLENGDDKEFVEVFKNKVLMYLFDDAAKQKRKKLFEKCRDNIKGVRYSDLCNQFDNKGVFIFPDEISKRFTEMAKPEENKE